VPLEAGNDVDVFAGFGWILPCWRLEQLAGRFGDDRKVRSGG